MTIEVTERNIWGKPVRQSTVGIGEVREFKAWGGCVTVGGNPGGGWVKENWIFGHGDQILGNGGLCVFQPSFFHPPTILRGIGKGVISTQESPISEIVISSPFVSTRI